MNLKLSLIIFLTLASNIAAAEKYNCVATINSPKTTKSKKLWSIVIELKKKSESQVVLFGDNVAIPLDDIINGVADAKVLQDLLSQYNGNLLVGLAKTDDVLKISQGYIDSKQKNFGPFEALAWGDLKSKKIGLKNIQRELEFECTK